jgi:adenine-specific DNA-methyltransferase
MARTRRKKRTGPVPIDATKHPGDSRTNIPTAELESFAEDEERKPSSLLYPRDPSLDPQLVWKGKDEQDRTDLVVPAVPIYIQETIEPRALIEDLRAQFKRERPDDQIAFFDSFEGLDFTDRVEFYQHEGKWTNRMILGDSLLVMASLAEKEGLKGQVQMIYLDPPYGIKFGSNWQVSTRKREVKDGKAEDATRQPEQIRAFRDTWELGIHSYLSYLRDRLVVGLDLLAESGSLFVQIGHESVHLVRTVLDEVLGSENFIALIPFRKKTMPLGTEFLEQMDDFLLWYAKRKEIAKYRPLFRFQSTEGDMHYQWAELPDGTVMRLAPEQMADYKLLPPDARPYRHKSLEPSGPMEAGRFTVTFHGKTYPPPPNGFATGPEGMKRLLTADRIGVDETRLGYKLFADDFPVSPLTAPWQDTIGPRDKVFVVQTSARVIERCLLMTTDPGDLAVDPTCGSGTTAHVAEHWGRRWITIDTSRVALALARTRLMTARYPYYLLADSPEGQLKEAELSGHASATSSPSTKGDVKKGFVYERVRHVTLKSIANNPDIKEGMTREEIDASLARHTDAERLYDRPYVDPRVVRVSGPFTVESLSPHRVLSQGADMSDPDPMIDPDAGRFVDHIQANLRKAGVQNTVKGERLTFDRLDPWPGVYIQAAGDYTENGKTRTAAVCIGPEHGTVGTELVREAAKEAMKFADLLVMCGFAFEALVGDETSKVGRLTILKAKMNPDLEMPELLKKTGAGNLFMVFGEPDVDIRADDDSVIVEIRGVDVYDPTTGVIRSHSIEDIACWFIDTDYNGESFFVRHAYFLGAGDPYGKLKRALRADIDEEAWASLYRTVSRPFPKPSTGKIAMKVNNHYGDEVLKVYQP